MIHAGKVALVIGASRNMGEMFAQAVAADGAAVAVHYNAAASADAAHQVVAGIVAHGGQAAAFQADITQLPQLVGLFDAVEARFGGIDIVINTAGAIIKKPVSEVSEDEFDAVSAINSKAAFFTLREAARRLRDDGRIVSVSTSLTAATTSLYGAYAGAKAALEAYTRAVAKEIGHRGITVNALSPGPLDTAFFHANATPEAVAQAKKFSVTGELGQLADLVPLLRLLLAPGGRWITGQAILINGGMVAR